MTSSSIAGSASGCAPFCPPLALAKLAQINRAPVMIGGAAKKHLTRHLAAINSALEAIGDGAAFVAGLELHVHVLSCEFADHVALELLRLLAAAELAALLVQPQPMFAFAVQELHSDVPVPRQIGRRAGVNRWLQVVRGPQCVSDSLTD